MRETAVASFVFVSLSRQLRSKIKFFGLGQLEESSIPIQAYTVSHVRRRPGEQPVALGPFLEHQSARHFVLCSACRCQHRWLPPSRTTLSDFIDGSGGRTRDRTLDLSRMKGHSTASAAKIFFLTIRRPP